MFSNGIHKNTITNKKGVVKKKKLRKRRRKKRKRKELEKNDRSIRKSKKRKLPLLLTNKETLQKRISPKRKKKQKTPFTPKSPSNIPINISKSPDTLEKTDLTNFDFDKFGERLKGFFTPQRLNAYTRNILYARIEATDMLRFQ